MNLGFELMNTSPVQVIYAQRYRTRDPVVGDFDSSGFIMHRRRRSASATYPRETNAEAFSQDSSLTMAALGLLGVNVRVRWMLKGRLCEAFIAAAKWQNTHKRRQELCISCT